MLSVIPERPANLSVVNRTFDSALLHWTVPFPMQHFPPGLYHRIMYQNQWDHQKNWQVSLKKDKEISLRREDARKIH